MGKMSVIYSMYVILGLSTIATKKLEPIWIKNNRVMTN